MADVRDCEARKSRKRSYVTLMENESEPVQHESSIVIGDRVVATAVKRSGLLSGLEHTEGLASLPAHLTPEDVRLWQTACVVDFALPLDELVTVLKVRTALCTALLHVVPPELGGVAADDGASTLINHNVADALGDADDNKWVHDLADRATATDWQHAEHSGAMLCALFSLPEPLCHRVIARCQATKDLPQILATFPAPLHPAIAATAARNGSLQMCGRTAAALLSALPSTVVRSPGLLSLSVTPGAKTSSAPLTQATAAHLARAAAAHPTLTSLSLNGHPLAPQWLRSFAACLTPGALPALVSLTLTADAHPGGCAAAAACLARLPSLTTLDITMYQGCAEATVSLQSYARLAATPSSLPHLQQLKLSECCDSEDGETQHNRSCTTPLLLMLSMPALTKLVISGSYASVQVRDLVTAIARCPVLKVLRLDSLQLKPRASLDVFTAATAEFPPLFSLSIEDDCPFPLLAIAASALARGSLTSLKLEACEVSLPQEAVRSMRRGSQCKEFGDSMFQAWSRFLPQLGLCTGLQELTLDCFVCLSREAEGFTAAFASQLKQLTQLTQLSLYASEPRDSFQGARRQSVFLEGRSFGEALSCLTALQDLSFASLGEECFRFDTVQPVIDACIGLGKLESMNLCVSRVTVAQATQLLEQSRRLTRCGFYRDVFPQLEDVLEVDHEWFVEFSARYPTVDIHLCDVVPADDSEESG